MGMEFYSRSKRKQKDWNDRLSKLNAYILISMTQKKLNGNKT